MTLREHIAQVFETNAEPDTAFSTDVCEGCLNDELPLDTLGSNDVWNLVGDSGAHVWTSKRVYIVWGEENSDNGEILWCHVWAPLAPSRNTRSRI